MVSLQKGLVGYWTMDDSDTSGGTLYDSSAYNNHGTLNGPSQTTGLFNGAYDFEDDSSDYVDLGVVGDEFAIGRGDYTFSVWANFESITSTSTIFELSRFTDALLVRPDIDGPQLQIYMRNQETNDTFFPNIEGNTGKWYHFVIRRTGGVLEVFENNTSLGTKSEMDGVFEINQESYIGKSVHTNNQNHDGLLQDMRFYDRALSKSEISALYNMRSQRQQNSSITVDNFSRNNLDPYKLTNSPLNQISSTNPRNGQHHGQSNTDGSAKSMSYSLNGLSKYPNSGDDIYAYVYPTGPNDVLFFDWGIQGDTPTEAGFPEEGGYAAEIRFESNTLNVFVDSTLVKSGNFTSDGVDRWYYYKISWGNNGKQVVSIEDPQDSSEYISLTFNDSQYNTGGIGWGMDNSKSNSSEAYWDYIFTT